ncbi:MAG: hypothetical protein ACTSU4_12500 [Promethearchaeota archaeon]
MIGLIYIVIGYVSRIIQGKEIVFSPIISILIGTPFFWPMMVYADIIHVGLKIED